MVWRPPAELLFAVFRFHLAADHFLPWPFCARALAAAVLEAALVRPSLKTLLAAVAALLLVCLAFLATGSSISTSGGDKLFQGTRRLIFDTSALIPVVLFHLRQKDKKQKQDLSCTLGNPAAVLQLGLLAFQVYLGRQSLAHFFGLQNYKRVSYSRLAHRKSRDKSLR